MTTKTRLLIAGSAALLLAAIAVYMTVSRDSNVAAQTDAANLEALRQASEEAQAKSPPPVKFNDLPAEPSDGRRIPTR